MEQRDVMVGVDVSGARLDLMFVKDSARLMRRQSLYSRAASVQRDLSERSVNADKRPTVTS